MEATDLQFLEGTRNRYRDVHEWLNVVVVEVTLMKILNLIRKLLQSN